jgi:hypothetical protein
MSENTCPAQRGTDTAMEPTFVPPEHDSTESTLLAYELRGGEGYELVTAPPRRRWMDATNQHFANRCLPLLMANQSGWFLLNNFRQRVKWNGGVRRDSIEIESDNAKSQPGVTSHFGYGIITWNIPFLFRTPPGYNLLVRGPANYFKDGIAPVEGLVETDWAPATFTVNWRFTRKGVWVTFEQGEPLCMLVPRRRGELEGFVPQILPVEANPELQASYGNWLVSRTEFNRDLNDPASAAANDEWQKDYFRGRSLDGSKASEHQTRLHLRSFTQSQSE